MERPRRTSNFDADDGPDIADLDDLDEEPSRFGSLVSLGSFSPPAVGGGGGPPATLASLKKDSTLSNPDSLQGSPPKVVAGLSSLGGGGGGVTLKAMGSAPIAGQGSVELHPQEKLRDFFDIFAEVANVEDGALLRPPLPSPSPPLPLPFASPTPLTVSQPTRPLALSSGPPVPYPRLTPPRACRETRLASLPAADTAPCVAEFDGLVGVFTDGIDELKQKRGRRPTQTEKTAGVSRGERCTGNMIEQLLNSRALTAADGEELDLSRTVASMRRRQWRTGGLFFYLWLLGSSTL